MFSSSKEIKDLQFVIFNYEAKLFKKRENDVITTK